MKFCYANESLNDAGKKVQVMVGIVADAQRLNRSRAEFSEIFCLSCWAMTGLRTRPSCRCRGEGMRISADKLREAISQSPSLQSALLRFAHAFMNQTANTALSNGTASLEERLARWLLMANDRLRGDKILSPMSSCH